MVATTGLVVVLLLIGSLVSTLLIARESLRADRAYHRADKNFRTVREAVDRFGSQLAQRLADIPGTEKVRRELLHDTLRYYQDFIDQAQGDPSLRADIALAYSQIATITDKIGSNDEAIVAHQTALRQWEQLVAEQPESVDDAAQVGAGRK